MMDACQVFDPGSTPGGRMFLSHQPLNTIRLFEEMDEFYQMFLVVLGGLEDYSLAVIGAICIRNEIMNMVRYLGW